MATVTKAAPAASDEKELLISGSEAVAEGLTLADLLPFLNRQTSVAME